MKAWVEHRLLIFKCDQSLRAQCGDWRLVDHFGIPYAQDISPDSLVAPADCNPYIANDVTDLIRSWEGKWYGQAVKSTPTVEANFGQAFLGILCDGQEATRSGLRLEPYTRRAVLEKVNPVEDEPRDEIAISDFAVEGTTVCHIFPSHAAPGNSQDGSHSIAVPERLWGTAVAASTI